MRANLSNKGRLQLHKETLRSLSPNELGRVAGATGVCQFFSLNKGACKVIETATHIPDTGPQSMPGACGRPLTDISILINPEQIVVGG